MRVVLDTNVFISGIFWSGNCGVIIALFRAESFLLITSEEILEEVERVLARFDQVLATQWNDVLRKNSLFVTPAKKFDIVEDPSDNKFIDAAIEGNADVIVTGDTALLRIGNYAGIKIISPKEFLNEFFHYLG